MTRIFVLLLLTTGIPFCSTAQVIPSGRTVNWSLAGLKNGIQDYPTIVNIADYGGTGDGSSPTNTALSAAINSLNNTPGVIQFNEGTYLFDQVINLPDAVIIRGKGAELTTLRFTASGDLIQAKGSIENQEINVLESAGKNQNYLVLNPNHGINPGDFILLTLNDDTLVTSAWALRSVGQINKIAVVHTDTVFLSSPLRMDYPLSLSPWIKKINPRKNVGIECMKIVRGSNDNFQSNNILFEYSVESWVKGIESDSCNYAHIAISNSSNIEIRNSFFQNAYSYGNGGKGYGVMIHMTAGECLVENNIFRQLRHAMILQAGANGNVFGYNYSVSPYWTEVSLPSGSAGDMVLHGNYVYANLFEGNIGQNIVIDDSHGKNGPYNTFFRNRAERYGIFMNNAPASDRQNIVGNEITNTGLTLGLYLLSGTDHFLYGNTVKGTLNPSGTQLLPEASYYHSSFPSFLSNTGSFPAIGTPTLYNTGNNAAKVNYLSGTYSYCHADLPPSSAGTAQQGQESPVAIFPNPSKEIIHVRLNKMYPENSNVQMYDVSGKLVYSVKLTAQEEILTISSLKTGFYMIHINFEGKLHVEKIYKQ